MTDFERFLVAQRNAIDKSIYIASEKAHRNLRFDFNGTSTDDYIFQWVDMHADKFRDAWEQSLCKTCKRISQCYDCLKNSCTCFETEN
jgi:hypothetical protein